MPLPLPVEFSNMPGGGAFAAYKAIGEGNNALRKGQLENQFLPLNTAIKAQNALTYSGKGGAISNYLRSIMALPAADREQYFADPNNRKNFLSMVEQSRQGIGQNNGNSFLSPQMVSQSFVGTPMEMPGNNNAMAQQNMPTAPSQNPIADDKMGTGYNTEFDEATGMPTNPSPHAQIRNGTGMPSEAPSQAQPEPTEPTAAKPLTIDERNTLTAQKRVNDKAIGKVQAARADGADTLDHYLATNQPIFSKVLEDAIAYSGTYGRGANWLDKLKKDQPERYANYEFAKNSLLTNIANQIKFMEHMGATNTQLHEAQNMVVALDKLEQSPETAARVINKSMKSLYDLSDSIHAVAEPAYPGVRKRLAGIPTMRGDYVKMPTSEAGENIRVRGPKGTFTVKATDYDKWPENAKSSYARVD